jgi:hypothetical protein
VNLSLMAVRRLFSASLWLKFFCVALRRGLFALLDFLDVPEPPVVGLVSDMVDDAREDSMDSVPSCLDILIDGAMA